MGFFFFCFFQTHITLQKINFSQKTKQTLNLKCSGGSGRAAVLLEVFAALIAS